MVIYYIVIFDVRKSAFKIMTLLSYTKPLNDSVHFFNTQLCFPPKKLYVEIKYGIKQTVI